MTTERVDGERESEKRLVVYLPRAGGAGGLETRSKSDRPKQPVTLVKYVGAYRPRV